jgi:hypothetical protein
MLSMMKEFAAVVNDGQVRLSYPRQRSATGKILSSD